MSATVRPHVLVPFACPHCGAANGVHLVTLSREGSMKCAGCDKRLRTQDVMRAMAAARARV